MLRCAAVFSDHMVLQRRRPITIWGDAGAGEEVTALLGTDSASVTADGQGHWKLVLPPREARGPLALILESGGERRVFIDVMVGEVWLAGGQSNMEMPLRDCRGGRREAAGSGGRNVRFYKVPRCPVTGGELTRMEENSRWLACSPQTSGGMSAVAWFFAVRIAESQGVTVGVVDCCWGGTSVSCWMSRERLESTRAGQAYIDSYANLMGDKTDEEYRREMDEYNARFQEWSGRVEALRSEDPHIPWETVNRICGYCPWPQPAGRESPFRPAGLYYSMLQRVCPYGLRGFIYYQGEEDVQRHRSYGEMMTCLIDLWRTDWGDVELPFLFVQLPMYCKAGEYARHEDDKSWACLRDQQWKVSRTVANTGLAVLADCGEFDNVHPLDKRIVGERLALLARRKVYGEDVTAEGPRARAARRRGKYMEVRFDGADGALKIKGNCLEGFELAGADGVYYEARGEAGLDSVLLWAPEVPEPETVRYAWTNYGPANLYNAAGLPAAPFRTDTQPFI